jgi:hypothetical protein
MTIIWREIGIPVSVYKRICLINSSARCCFPLGVVRTSKLGVSGAACGVRQVLRTMVASSASKVEKLCTGAPSSSVWLATLANAFLERLARATGSRVALAWANARRASDRFGLGVSSDGGDEERCGMSGPPTAALLVLRLDRHAEYPTSVSVQSGTS